MRWLTVGAGILALLVAFATLRGREAQTPAPPTAPAPTPNPPAPPRSDPLPLPPETAEGRAIWRAIASIEMDVPTLGEMDVNWDMARGVNIDLYDTFEHWRDRSDALGQVANALYALGEDYIADVFDYADKIPEDGPYAVIRRTLQAFHWYYWGMREMDEGFGIAADDFEALADAGVPRSLERAAFARYAEALRACAKAPDPTPKLRQVIVVCDRASAASPDCAAVLQIRGESRLRIIGLMRDAGTLTADMARALSEQTAEDLRRAVELGQEDLRWSREGPALRRRALGDAECEVARLLRPGSPGRKAAVTRAREAYVRAGQLNPKLAGIFERIQAAERLLESD